ncbi:LOW QUALITY PROTEIN: butyrophilin subfamily 3 member A3-like [Mastomys coucha]|uniref:LOW QUALITY PROTEIN: butyrophilin subfamily 3 member A3-like n=1 Tax=Mastomys coucha TaxID=35658 RepID=UPI0012616463|nr:LOW QUALITY PROTEIN: butyrophilin subfamily 3 member A3-like [Mastomys coucha]
MLRGVEVCGEGTIGHVRSQEEWPLTTSPIGSDVADEISETGCDNLLHCLSSTLENDPGEQFLVFGPSDPTVAVRGGEAVLPCSVFPAMSLEDMEELRWFRTRFSEAVLVYRDQEEQKEGQMPEYSWRTLLVKDQFHQGKAPVRIQNVQASDSGIYVCHFKQGLFYEEAILELKVAGCYLLRREHSARREVQQKLRNLPREKDELQQTKEDALRTTNVLKEELGRRKAAYNAAWRKAQLYADWRKEHFQAWTFTLDPDSAHPNLAISQDKMSVTQKDSTVCLDDLFTVLGIKGISSGRYYWEVKLRNREGSKWILGVCREGVDRKDFYFERPDKGFWTVGQSGSGYWAYIDTGRASLSIGQAPQSIGVFVDYTEGDISFYNMSDMSHLFSFHEASFSGNLFPYFRIRSGEVSMIISSMTCASEVGEGEEGRKGKKRSRGKEREEGKDGEEKMILEVRKMDVDIGASPA